MKQRISRYGKPVGTDCTSFQLTNFLATHICGYRYHPLFLFPRCLCSQKRAELYGTTTLTTLKWKMEARHPSFKLGLFQVSVITPTLFLRTCILLSCSSMSFDG